MEFGYNEFTRIFSLFCLFIIKDTAAIFFLKIIIKQTYLWYGNTFIIYRPNIKKEYKYVNPNGKKFCHLLRLYW